MRRRRRARGFPRLPRFWRALGTALVFSLLVWAGYRSGQGILARSRARPAAPDVRSPRSENGQPGRPPVYPPGQAPAAQAPRVQVPAPRTRRQPQASPAATEDAPPPEEHSAGRQPGVLTLPQCVGQMLMIGISGKSLTAAEARFIRERHIGGVILFRRNVSSLAQVQRLTSAIQAAAREGSGVPALISVDQEGGQIVRLGRRTGMPVFPSNRRLVATGDLERVSEAGRQTGRFLRRVGINMNLAPVLDVVADPNRGVIGHRSFGGDPAVVGRWGGEYISALQSAGVIATAKHFPGHGATPVDSHLRMPVVALSNEELWDLHIRPFQEAVQAGVGAVMPAHIAYTALDARAPATLSPTILRNLLRQKLDFQGIVISDSLNMGAIANRGAWEDTVRRAVAAGIDILLIPEEAARQRRAFDALMAGVRKDPDLEAAVLESTQRILDIKQRFELGGL